jgi:hypothetical protein
MPDRARVETAVQQIVYARDHTQRLLADIPDDLWFTQPFESANHIAWQVGHLAVAEYGLCLFRIRGRMPGDNQLMPSAFRKRFSRGTTPDGDPSRNPSPQELRLVFDDVHQRAKEELSAVLDGDLTDSIDMPYAVEPTKLGGLYFCSAHEMLHAGQIGALRRWLGKSPL